MRNDESQSILEKLFAVEYSTWVNTRWHMSETSVYCCFWFSGQICLFHLLSESREP